MGACDWGGVIGGLLGVLSTHLSEPLKRGREDWDPLAEALEDAPRLSLLLQLVVTVQLLPRLLIRRLIRRKSDMWYKWESVAYGRNGGE